MTKKDLMILFQRNLRKEGYFYTLTEVEKLIDTIHNSIQTAVNTDAKLKLYNFGTFDIFFGKAKRIGDVQNPPNIITIMPLPAVRFKLSEKVKGDLNNKRKLLKKD